MRVGESFAGGRLATTVPVESNVTWGLFHGDPSMGGPTTWGYRLVRDSVGGPWRISGHNPPG